MSWLRCGSGAEKPTLLWTNSSPTSDFAGQTISLDDDINKYEFIGFEIKSQTSGSGIYTPYTTNIIKKIRKDKLDVVAIQYSNTDTTEILYARWFTINSSNSTITISRALTSYNNTRFDNGCIPVKIYGYKKSLV